MPKSWKTAKIEEKRDKYLTWNPLEGMIQNVELSFELIKQDVRKGCQNVFAKGLGGVFLVDWSSDLRVMTVGRVEK